MLTKEQITNEDFLRDIREAVRRIRMYTDAMTYDCFLADVKTQDAVIRNLEIIRRLVETEDAFPEAFAHPPVHPAPVAVIAPLAALARMAVSGPSRQLVVEHVGRDLEGVFGDTVLVVVGPTLDEGIEGVDEGRLGCAPILTDGLP